MPKMNLPPATGMSGYTGTRPPQAPFVGPLAQEFAQAPPSFSAGLGSQPLPMQYVVPEGVRSGMPFTDRDNALMRLVELANQRQQKAYLMDQQSGAGDQAMWQRLFHETAGVGTWQMQPPKMPDTPGWAPDTARARQRFSQYDLGGSGV